MSTKAELRIAYYAASAAARDALDATQVAYDTWQVARNAEYLANLAATAAYTAYDSAADAEPQVTA